MSSPDMTAALVDALAELTAELRLLRAEREAARRPAPRRTRRGPKPPAGEPVSQADREAARARLARGGAWR